MNKDDLDIDISNEGKLPVTKIDAAVRQMETAVTLWFHDADPVSIATLSYASYQIISDLNKLRGGTPMNMDDGRGNVKPEYMKSYRRIMRSTPNFFKHADQDPDETHFFSPDVTTYILFEAIAVYSSWNMEKRPLFQLFASWMTIEHPNIFKQEYITTIQGHIDNAEWYKQVGKLKYYETTLSYFMKIC